MNDAVMDFKGACHCGAVRFSVRLTDGLRSARRCTCSYCRMRGAVPIPSNTVSMSHALKGSARSILKKCRSTTVRAIPRTDFQQHGPAL
jgi:hypothetical protein